MPYPPSIQASMELEKRFNKAKHRANDPLLGPFKTDTEKQGDGKLIMFCVDKYGKKIEELGSVSFSPNITDAIAV